MVFVQEGSSETRRVELTEVSVAGLAFAADDGPVIEIGSVLKGAIVCLGGSKVTGDLQIKGIRAEDGARVFIGCMFYAASPADETEWAVLAGIEAALLPTPDTASTADGSSAVDGAIDSALAFAAPATSDTATPAQRSQGLIFRCRGCHGSILIPDMGPIADPTIVHCPSCSQEYDLMGKLRHNQLREVHQQAGQLALENGIDMPAAYSVVLDVMTLNQVKDLFEGGATVRVSSPAPGSERRRPTMFDPAFQRAVDKRWLTREQAALRGKRHTFVERLVERHRLSHEQAAKVADNRMTLLQAIRSKAPGRPIEIQRDAIVIESERSWGTLTKVSIVVAASVLALSAFLIPKFLDSETDVPVVAPIVSKPQEAEMPTVLEGGVEILSGPGGRLTQVAASEPLAVLEAYCSNMKGVTPLKPRGLESANDGWIGLFRRGKKMYGLTILRDPARGMWVTGDGRNAIVPELVPR